MGKITRFVVTFAVVLVSSVSLYALNSNSYLWLALDSFGYDYNASVIEDNGTFRAYWVTTYGAAEDTEFVMTQYTTGTGDISPWNFYSGQPHRSDQIRALRTSGARIMRWSIPSGDKRDIVDQLEVGPGGSYGSPVKLGYLRRTPAASATIGLWECQGGSNHFISGFPSIECPGTDPPLLGYAHTSNISGTAERFRCFSSTLGDHFTSTNSSCEGLSTYVNEGTVGFWRVGTTMAVNDPGGATNYDVSPFPDGAWVAPNSVIKDSDSLYYMAYTASPNYGYGGPFNEIFLAVSSNGVNFEPTNLASNGDPIPIATTSSAYRSAVLGGCPSVCTIADGNAYGVGTGTLFKAGSTYYLYYLDTTRGSPQNSSRRNWTVKSATGSPASLQSASEGDVGIVDQTGAALTGAIDPHAVKGNLAVTYDEVAGIFWMFYTPDFDRTKVNYSRSTNGSGTTFYVPDPGKTADPDRTGSLAWPSGSYTNRLVSGIQGNRYGVVSSTYGWYVYQGLSGSGGLGLDLVGVGYFRP